MLFRSANIYFDGSVISYNLRFPDHARKTIGVILPATVRFATDGPEIIEIVSGKCRVRVGDAGDWHNHQGGSAFKYPASLPSRLRQLSRSITFAIRATRIIELCDQQRPAHSFGLAQLANTVGHHAPNNAGLLGRCDCGIDADGPHTHLIESLNKQLII